MCKIDYTWEEQTDLGVWIIVNLLEGNLAQNLNHFLIWKNNFTSKI